MPGILLVTPIQRYNSQIVFEYGLGAAYICAHLIANGIDAEVFTCPDCTEKELVKKIISKKAKLVGFYCTDTTYYFIKLISNAIKTISKSVCVILGGPTATLAPELLLRDCPSIDYCVRGYGEDTIINFLRKPDLRTSNDVFEGIAKQGFRLQNFQVGNIYIPQNDSINVLDKYPSPYLSGVLPRDYNVGIITNRGCGYRCSYCAFSASNAWEVRSHSVERVIEEIRYIAKIHHLPHIIIWDDDFCVDPSRTKILLRMLSKNKIQARFSCNARPDKVDIEIIRLMSETGFVEVNFGLETANPQTLVRVNKVANSLTICESELEKAILYIEKTMEAVKNATKYGLKVSLSSIIGLPGETTKDLEATYWFYRKSGAHTLYSTYLKPYIGTPICKANALRVNEQRLKKVQFEMKGCSGYELCTILPVDASLLPDWYLYENITIPTKPHGLAVFEVYKEIEVGLTGLIDAANKQYFIIIKGKPLQNHPSCVFIKSIITYSTKTIVFCNEYDEEVYLESVNAIISNKIPLQTYFYLVKKCPDKIKYSRCLRYRRLAIIRQKNIEYLYKLSVKDDNNIEKIYLVNPRVDEIYSYYEDDRFKLPIAGVSYPIIFQDACRWGKIDCIEVLKQRIMINESGMIMPCENCTKKCHCSMGIDKYLQQHQVLFNEIRAKRDCKSCPVLTSCAKCMYLGDVTTKEYCQMMRNAKIVETYIQAVKKMPLLKRKIEETKRDIGSIYSIFYDRKSGRYVIHFLDGENSQLTSRE